MGGTISVLIADDSAQVRQAIRAMLQLEDGFVVAGEAADGQEAVDQARLLRPDVVLMDINMPVLDGIAATAAILREVPAGVVIISVQGETEYLRRAMQAGARDYLVKPFTCADLVAAIRRAAEAAGGSRAEAPPPVAGQVITVFSTKGGVGKSLLAANLAAALAARTRLQVAAVDLDLEFGVLASLLGARPVATWVDLCRVPGPLTADHLEKVLARPIPHLPLRLLAAPPAPYLAAEVDGEGRSDPGRNYVAEVLDLLRLRFDYVVVDTGLGFRESILTALDKADRTLLVTVPEVPALQNTAKALEVLLERLEYPRDRVELVLNRVGAEGSLAPADVGKVLAHPVAHTLPYDPAAAAWAANAGQPLALRRARSPLGDAVAALAQRLLGGHDRPVPAAPAAAPLAPALATAGGRRRFLGLF